MAAKTIPVIARSCSLPGQGRRRATQPHLPDDPVLPSIACTPGKITRQGNLSRWVLAAIVTLATLGSAQASPLVLSPLIRNIFGYTTSGRVEAPYDAKDSYVVAGNAWNVLTNPSPPVYLPGTATPNFIDTLKAAFPETAGWSYSSRLTDLADTSFVVHTYDSEHNQDPGRKDCDHCVGAEFDLQYLPTGTDPTKNLHWIQVFTGSDGTGLNEKLVDNGGAPDPYYDDRGTATARNFYDFPNSGVDTDAIWHNWQFELFLVTGPGIGAGPGPIEIEGGIRWGWTNGCAAQGNGFAPDANMCPAPVFTPEPATLSLFTAGGLLIAVGSWRKRKRAPHSNEVSS